MPLRLATRILAILAIVPGAAIQGPTSVTPRSFESTVKIDDTNDDASNIHSGDVDGDKDIDLLLVKGRHGDGAILLLINDGRGHFESREIAQIPANTYDAPLIDADADGDLDILVASSTTEAQIVYVNTGKGRFVPSGLWADAVPGARNAVVADLNGDRRPDIVVASVAGPSSVCLNGGRLRFACTLLHAGSIVRLVPADLDNDGDLDLVAPAFLGQSVVFSNDGHGGFSRSMPFGPSETETRAAAAGDLDGDGWQDLVLADIRTGVWVYLNDGRGGLRSIGQLTQAAAAGRHAIEEVAYRMVIADINGDQRADLVIGNASGAAGVLFNDGTGRSFRAVSFGDGEGQLYGLAVADLDGDGPPDLAAAVSGAPSRVYFNRPGGVSEDIRVSETLEARVTLPSQKPRNPERPILGVWQGALRQGDGGITRGPRLRNGETYNLEILIERLVPGEASGRTVYHSPKSIVRCSTVNVLESASAAGTFRLREVPDHCPRAGLSFQIRVGNDDRLVLEYLSETGAPVLTATLDRKAGGTR